jgi:16S rRNA (uracil1498-N3)-methyltransferase
MRLSRVFVDTPLSTGAHCEIDGAAANHIVRVLRLRNGDELTVFDGRGGEYAARVDSIRKDVVFVDVREHRALERESSLQLTLAQGVSRGERMDLVIQKATELGVHRISPVLTERSVVKLDATQSERKHQHWRGIVVAACEQCGRNTLPVLDAPTTLYDFLSHTPDTATRLLLSPEGTTRPRDLKSATALTLLIGPEGGLSENEQSAAVDSGFERVSLGPRILRTETAALAALATLQALLGDF